MSQPAETGVIHDIGFRRYDGPRLGRAYLLRSLYVESLKGAYGLGRSAKSKVMPILLLVVVVLPALIIALVAGLTHASTLPLAYTSYVIDLSTAISVFVAAQSPASVSRDLRFKVMPLYFSRPLSRSDYVLAKFAAMATALYVLMALPLLALYLGALLGKLPFWAQTRGVLTGLAGAVLLALVLAAIGLARRLPHAPARLRRRRDRRRPAGAVAGGGHPAGADPRRRAPRGGRLLRHGLAVHPRGRRPGLAVRGEAQLAGRTARHPRRRGLPGREPGRRGRLLCRAAAALPQGGRLVSASLVLDGVSRWYGNVVAVNDVSMTIGPGVTGLLGPNGAGKSTLIHLMSGFLAPSSGSVTLGGEPTWHNEPIYRRIGLVPEREAMYDGVTGWDFVVANAKLQGLPDAQAASRSAIATVDMLDAKDRDISTYSKGMKQRIKMATALVHDPEVLLLDEPFNGMDPRQRLQLMDLLVALGHDGRVVLFSSHILEEVEQIAANIEVMVAGRHAASGDFREIRRLMTERPHEYTIRSSDDRALAAALIAEGSTSGVQLGDGELSVQASDYARFAHRLPVLARAQGVRLFEVSPADESLEKVFSYLVSR